MNTTLLLNDTKEKEVKLPVHTIGDYGDVFDSPDGGEECEGVYGKLTKLIKWDNERQDFLWEVKIVGTNLDDNGNDCPYDICHCWDKEFCANQIAPWK